VLLYFIDDVYDFSFVIDAYYDAFCEVYVFETYRLCLHLQLLHQLPSMVDPKSTFYLLHHRQDHHINFASQHHYLVYVFYDYADCGPLIDGSYLLL
jgi:hypothetical protein